MDSKDILILNINRFDHYIAVANNKANWLLSVMLTLFFGVVAFMGYADVVKHILKMNHIISSVFSFSCCALIFYNIQAFYFLSKVLSPNLKSNLGGDSVIFFGDIVKNGLNSFSQKINDFNSEKIIKDLQEQVFILAEIANMKYQYIIMVNNLLIFRIIPVSLFVLAVSLLSKIMLG